MNTDRKRTTVLDYLFPDEQDRYLSALDRRDTEAVTETYHGVSDTSEAHPKDPAMMFPETSVDKQGWVFARMTETYGGGFAQKLGEAYIRADGENGGKIRRTWPEYWIKYVIFGLNEQGPVSQ